jgi:cytochrome P450
MRRDPLFLFMQAAALGSEVVSMRFGPVGVYALLGPNAVRHALVEHPDRFVKGTRGQQLMQRVLGDSTLTTTGAAWRPRRRLVQPTFKRSNIAGFACTMEQLSADLATKCEGLASQGLPLDVAAAMNGLTLRIVTTSLFGTALGAKEAQIHQALSDILDGFLGLATAPYPLADRMPTRLAIRHRAAVRTMRGVVEGLIAERRQSDVPRDDLLGALMAADADGVLSDDDLVAEVATLMLAGHETTANALTWTLVLLSRHPGVARRLEAELDGLPPGPLSPGSARQLPLLDAVLRESMRLFPPAWVISRSSVQDEVVAGYSVPAGSYLYAVPYALHRDPKVWDNPEGFDPDRWLDGRVGRAQRQAWMPFGAGQHKCLGEHFAMLESVVVLATLLRRVRLSLVPGQRIREVASVTLRPDGPVRMTVERRVSGRRADAA